MYITVSKEQYENLLRLVHLGNWMVNAIHSGRPGDEQIEKYNNIEQFIFSFAKEAGLEHLIEYDQESGRFFPTRRFDEEDETEGYREEYDEYTFWEDLFYRLVDRDMVETYGEERIASMDFKERIEKEEPFREKYDKELEKYGVSRLQIPD